MKALPLGFLCAFSKQYLEPRLTKSSPSASIRAFRWLTAFGGTFSRSWWCFLFVFRSRYDFFKTVSVSYVCLSFIFVWSRPCFSTMALHSQNDLCHVKEVPSWYQDTMGDSRCRVNKLLNLNREPLLVAHCLYFLFYWECHLQKYVISKIIQRKLHRSESRVAAPILRELEILSAEQRYYLPVQW